MEQKFILAAAEGDTKTVLALLEKGVEQHVKNRMDETSSQISK
ncbi:hypothetical protein [Oceanobacillus timonensis]|nr:hypothetical protein [Oceanobacillus timonensis]